MVTADDGSSGSSGKFVVFSEYTCQPYPYTFYKRVYLQTYSYGFGLDAAASRRIPSLVFHVTATPMHVSNSYMTQPLMT